MSAVVKSKGGVSGKVGVMECFCSAGPSMIIFITNFKSTGIKKERAYFSLTADLWEFFTWPDIDEAVSRVMLGLSDLVPTWCQPSLYKNIIKHNEAGERRSVCLIASVFRHRWWTMIYTPLKHICLGNWTRCDVLVWCGNERQAAAEVSVNDLKDLTIRSLNNSHFLLFLLKGHVWFC